MSWFSAPPYCCYHCRQNINTLKAEQAKVQSFIDRLGYMAKQHNAYAYEQNIRMLLKDKVEEVEFSVSTYGFCMYYYGQLAERLGTKCYQVYLKDLSMRELHSLQKCLDIFHKGYANHLTKLASCCCKNGVTCDCTGAAQ